MEHPLYSLFTHLLTEMKESNRIMATIAEDLSTLTTDLGNLVTDDQGLRSQVTKLTDENAALTAELATMDPTAQADLVTAQAQIVALSAQIQALLNPPVPVPSVPEVFTFSGDPTTVDLATWPKATVTGAAGEVLYTWAGAPPAPVDAQWVQYTGVTQPAPVA